MNANDLEQMKDRWLIEIERPFTCTNGTCIATYTFINPFYEQVLKLFAETFQN